jgi:Domain of unknown function (DUF4431)
MGEHPGAVDAITGMTLKAVTFVLDYVQLDRPGRLGLDYRSRVRGIRLMLKLLVLYVLVFATGFCQECVTYGVPTTLSGTLSLRDESGYNQFVVFHPSQPICTVRGSGEVADDYSHKRSRVTEIQAGVYGSDAESGKLRERLDRLIGHHVIIRGDVFPATTGYHRTDVQLRVVSVDAADSGGQRALVAPRIPFKPIEAAAYDVTVNAGKRRLVIDTRDIATGVALVPPNQYAPHWMTGLEVIYIDCRDGYKRKMISSTEKNGGICFDGDLCGFSAFPEKPVTIKFRCTKKP